MCDQNVKYMLLGVVLSALRMRTKTHLFTMLLRMVIRCQFVCCWMLELGQVLRTILMILLFMLQLRMGILGKE